MERRCRSGHSEFRIYGEQRIPYGGVQEAYVRPQFPHKFENLESRAGYSQRDRRPILLPGHRIKPDVRKIAPDDRQLTSTLSSRLPTVFPAAEARRHDAVRCGAVRRSAVRCGRKRDVVAIRSWIREGRTATSVRAPPSGAYFANFVSARTDARVRSHPSPPLHILVRMYIHTHADTQRARCT